MKILFLPPLLLAGCATTDDYGTLSAIHAAVKQRITYRHYASAKVAYIPKGSTGSGNCAVYAFTMSVDAAAAGYSPKVHTCLTPAGEAHVYTEVNGWALDNRYSRVIPMGQQNCRDL